MSAHWMLADRLLDRIRVRKNGREERTAMALWKCLGCREHTVRMPVRDVERLPSCSLCKQKAVLVGQVVNELTVVDFAYVKATKRYWQCVCSCGNVRNAQTTQLTSGRAKHCGDMGRHHSGSDHPRWRGAGGVTGNYMNRLHARAQARGHECTVTPEYLNDLFAGVCALSGFSIELGTTASLDRVDSRVGYVPGNVQWVHKKINTMKWDFEQEDFVTMCCAVAKRFEELS